MKHTPPNKGGQTRGEYDKLVFCVCEIVSDQNEPEQPQQQHYTPMSCLPGLRFSEYIPKPQQCQQQFAHNGYAFSSESAE